MQVTIKLMGFPALLDSEGVRRDGPLVLSVPDDATIIDLLRQLAAEFGTKFEIEQFWNGTGLTGIAVFSDDELVEDPQARLADTRTGDITVTFMRGFAGGCQHRPRIVFWA